MCVHLFLEFYSFIFLHIFYLWIFLNIFFTDNEESQESVGLLPLKRLHDDTTEENGPQKKGWFLLYFWNASRMITLLNYAVKQKDVLWNYYSFMAYFYKVLRKTEIIKNIKLFLNPAETFLMIGVKNWLIFFRKPWSFYFIYICRFYLVNTYVNT